jgi:MoaA/NifB/PqqE/SkfB family radical SAM enzyme
MSAIKDSIFVGFSKGRIVLIPSNNALSLPVKYLSEASSIMLCAILNEDCYEKVLNDIFYKMNPDELIQRINELLNELKPYICDCKKEIRISFKKLEKSKSEKNNIEHSYFRLDYPVRLVVIPTWRCNRECAYCGVPKIKPIMHEDQINPQLLIERLLDAIDHGVQGIVYHGGEPIFFYKELFDQLRILNEKNIQIHLSTKNRITKSISSELSNAGMKQLQLSIDTIEPELSMLLYNDEFYANKLAESVVNLLNVGIKPRVNVVLSKLNFKGIPNLLQFLNNNHVSEVELSNYRCGSINDAQLELSKDDWAWLYHAMLKNQNKWSFENLIYSPFGDVIPPASQRSICESGRFGFLFLPNGEGCYCDFLCENPKFRVGDLNKHSVGEIWSNPKLMELAYPTKNSFDCKCTACKGFEHCVDRGFCYVKTNGEFKPDNKCHECFDDMEIK